MKTKRLIFILSYCVLIKVSSTQVIGVKHTASLSPGLLTGTNPSLITKPLSFDQAAPKCYPETATAYFLPAPPSSPKVTILDPNWKDITLSYNSKLPDIPPTQPSNLNLILNRENLEPPCTALPVLPDLIGELPIIIHDKFNRLVDTDAKGCETCSKLMQKLPIFNFDQELLDGFLSGLGLTS